MAKAKRVLSTPRITAPKNRVKKAANPEKHDIHHGKAFRDLDGSIHDLYCAAEIAAEVATGTQTDERLEMTHFALYQLRDMIVDLRTKYRSDLAAGKAVA
jgi:carotenoid cleavage dioxygenase-like enzyme